VLVLIQFAIFSKLEREHQVAQASANSFQTLLEAETQRTQLLQGVITSVCDGLGVKPNADTGEDTLGNSFVRRMAALGRLVRERIRGNLHHGMKRALAIIRSGFVFDMEFVANGFIKDPDRTDEENEDACLELIGAAEEPGRR
jgi:hypothetical protein